jgi:hypothetical protein
MSNKLKIVSSSEKLDTKSQWNRFHPDAWERFKNWFELIGKPYLEFVDVKEKHLPFWHNAEDTAVFIIHMKKKNFRIDPMALIRPFNQLAPDEFDYIPLTPNKYVVRLWWD